jgi:hypothetical protein
LICILFFPLPCLSTKIKRLVVNIKVSRII